MQSQSLYNWFRAVFGKDNVGRRHSLLVAIVFSAIRAIYWYGFVGSARFGDYNRDSLVLREWVQQIVAGSDLGAPFFRAPLYPYLLSMVYRVMGATPWSEIALNTVCSAITVFLSYHLAKNMFGRKAALLAALGVATYPTLLIFDGELLITSMAVLAFTAIAYTSFRAVERPSWATVGVAGLVIGLGALIRPTLLPLMIVLPLSLMIKLGWKRILVTLRYSAILVVATAVPILPVTLVNFIVGDDSVLISSQGGVNFYIGNRALSDGVTVQSPGATLRVASYHAAGTNGLLHDNVWTASVEEAEHHMGHKLKASEVSQFWYGRALDEIMENPWRAVAHNLRKFYLFWHGCEIFNNKPIYFVGEYSPVFGLLVWSKGLNFPSGVLFPLMLVGLLLGLNRRKHVSSSALSLLIFSLTVSAFFVCSRFRQPVIPVAIIFAAYGIVEMIRLANAKDRRLIPVIVGVVAGAVLFNWGGNIDSTENRSQSHTAVGVAYLNVKDYSRGVDHLEKSVALLPENVGAWIALTQGLLFSGDLDHAKDVHRRAATAHPSYAIFHFGLGNIAQQQQDLDKALKEYRATIYLAPNYGHAYWEICNVFIELKQYDSAMYYLQQLDILGAYKNRPDRNVADRIINVEALRSQ